MNKTQKIFTIAGVLSVAIIGVLFWVSEPIEQQEQLPSVANLYMKPDSGLNLEYVDLQSLGDEIGNVNPDSIGERVIFERYRFYDKKSLDEEIDIRADNVRVFVTTPDGTEEEITSGNIYYLMHIYPFAQGGTYAFRVETTDGAIYENKLAFPKPQQVDLVFGERTPENGEGVSMQALRMGDLNLNNAESVFHILTDNTIKDLIPDANGFVFVDATALAKDDHIFLAKQDGAWYYATFFTPEESE